VLGFFLGVSKCPVALYFRVAAPRARELIRRMLEAEAAGIPYHKFMTTLPYEELLILARELQHRLLKNIPVEDASGAGRHADAT
jgi:hypothetical protein